jgi:hypothetical protein
VRSKIEAFVEGRLCGEMKQSVSFKQMEGAGQLVKARQSTSGFALALNKENQNLHNKMLPNLLSFRKQATQVKDRERKDRKPSLFELAVARK